MDARCALVAADSSDAEAGLEAAGSAPEEVLLWSTRHRRLVWMASLGLAAAGFVSATAYRWQQSHREAGRRSGLDVLALAALPLQEPPLYASQATGLGTWYDPTKWGGGTCGYDYEWQPPGVAGTVALNFEDFNAGGKMASCGMCLQVWAKGDYPWNGHSGGGSLPMTWDGAIFFVTNSCATCPSRGDIDFALQPGQGESPGQNGNGQWDITWQAVPCPIQEGRGAQYMLDSGDNRYWVKARPLNLHYPVVGMDFREGGEWVPGTLGDQFGFSWNPSRGAAPSPLKIRMTSATGEVLVDELPELATWLNGSLHVTDKVVPEDGS